MPIVRRKQNGRYVSAAVVLVLAVWFLYSLAVNENMQWAVIGDYLFNRSILQGVLVTIELTVISMVVGIVGGVLLALMRASANPVLNAVSAAYIWLFRGTPLLVQILFAYNLASLYPEVGIPYVPALQVSANQVISPWTAAVLALSLNEAAYMAEIVRGGLLSIATGQREAAVALGMKEIQVLRRVVLPQALRVIVPPTGNEVINMLKTTSLVSVISITELLYASQQIYSVSFQTIPLLVVASIWYLSITSVLTLAQSRIEARLGKGQGARTSKGASPVLRQLGLTARVKGLR